MQGTIEKPGNHVSNNNILFDKIVATYQGPVMRYIQRLVGEVELSADLLQDTFLGVYTNLVNHDRLEENLTPVELLKGIQPLVYTIARNKALDELRRRNHIRFVSIRPLPNRADQPSGWQEDIDPAIEYKLSSPQSSLETRVIVCDELKRAIEQIGRQKLRSLMLHLDGYSYKEIGQITGETMPNVKSKIFRSKQSLRQVLTHY